MGDLPSMPLFVDDYEAATAHLTMEEDGAYNRLLRLCWRTPGCSVPDDDEWIMRRMRCDAETFERVIRPLINEFFKREKGRVFQKRQQQEFQRVNELVSKRKRAGTKGGRSKSLKTKESDPSKATVLPQANGKQTPSNAQAPIPITIPIEVEIDDDARASPPDQELIRLCVEAAGDCLRNPAAAPGLMVASEIRRWLTKYDLHLDVLPTLRAVGLRAPPASVGSWGYFTQAIADAHAKRIQPLPEGQIHERHSPNPQRGNAAGAVETYRRLVDRLGSDGQGAGGRDAGNGSPFDRDSDGPGGGGRGPAECAGVDEAGDGGGYPRLAYGASAHDRFR